MASSKALVKPIAVVGMSSRLPGAVSNTSKLWEILENGRSQQDWGDQQQGRIFLGEDVRSFDNAFFGINNLEAKYMDPQQRQLLEVVYECFESAGATLEEVSGANIGCYVAKFTTDFVTVQAKNPDLYHRYSATGFGPTILANRISHTFNLQGPSLVLDTACSSSLYALHMACMALNAGECDSAIVAGANLVQSPEAYIAMTKAGVLSSTSVSHTFDSSADGYGRGEGIAALYLKRMDSVRASDPVRSVVRGTAVNSNGRTPGITMPGKDGQESVIRKAYAMAGLPLDETSYVEAHGTGTPIGLGDPIEVEAISKCFTPKNGQPLFIGSVKPNVGHGEAVSGITSIIKATLALEHLAIPPTIGIQNLNPQLKLEERNMRVVTALQPWPVGAVERISVNSFGYGGANAHAILESARMHLTRNYLSISGRLANTLLLPLLQRGMDLLREGKIEPVSPLELFPASQIPEAFRYFASSTRIGKVVLTFSPSDLLPVCYPSQIVTLKHRTRFHAHKSYVLVGCLGGLGRSLAQWMLKRGARNFIFMGRSGTSKVAAQNIVTDLRAAGADVEVVRGDVSSYADVERTVLAAKMPVGGVVQAAMSIHVALFNETTHQKWHAGINQKIQGSLNLHKAISATRKTTQLDFFLLLSSVTGSIGIATESNYCAAGAFQDAFGSHLRSLGLPAVSIGLGMISEVGFLHENAGTEAVLLRKGLHPLTEEEFLQLIDEAITSVEEDHAIGEMAWGRNHYMEGHILTGLEFHGFQKHRDMGFVRGMVALEDPRFTYMAGAFAQAAEMASGGVEDNRSTYPQGVASALARNESFSVPSNELIEAVAAVVIARIATLLLVPSTQLQTTTRLADFGMESMLAAEFRSDMFRAFKVDVPFAVLMAQRTQVRSVAELVGQELLGEK